MYRTLKIPFFPLTQAFMVCLFSLSFLSHPEASFANPVDSDVPWDAIAARAGQSELGKPQKLREFFLPPGSNIQRIFGKSDYELPLLWLEENLQAHKRVEKPKKAVSDEAATIQVEYREEMGGEGRLFLDLIIPHPRFAESARLRLLEAVRQALPQKERVLEETTLQFDQGIEGKLYFIRNGSIKIVVPLALESLAILFTQYSSDSEQLIELAHSLNFASFNQNLPRKTSVKEKRAQRKAIKKKQKKSKRQKKKKKRKQKKKDSRQASSEN